MADLAGQTLADRYDLLERLGAGGMGEVYRARDRELDELVALKVIRADRAGDPELLARFRHEVKLARRVTHGNVARTFELGHDGSITFCTMELVQGESLTRRLGARGKLAVAEAAAIAAAVCDGLDAAHAVDVIHRDIKPDNILLASDGRVVVADFGIAAVGVARDSDPAGTPQYMAPEQARGEPASPASDVYAVGVVLYEMTTGRRAFAGDALAVLDAKQQLDRLTAPELPPEFDEVIGRATARDAAARIASAAALRHALAPWLGGERRPRAASRQVADARELHRVVVLAPRGDGALLYVADAVHEGVLAALSRRPRVRVLPRTVAPADHDGYVVAFAVGSQLQLELSRGGERALVLDLPLAVGQVAAAVEAALAAIVAALGLASAPVTSSEASELLLRARSMMNRSALGADDAVALLDRAAAIAPGDPRIAAAIAMVSVRRAFVGRGDDEHALARATELARAAVATAPELADAHVAIGHVALHRGDAVGAAGHFRVAIARSPHDAEAHDYLGRLLLEAGYLDLALARLEEAIAIAPRRAAVRWEVARAFALEQRWAEYDALVDELVRGPSTRAFFRARVELWRGNAARAAELARAPSELFHDAYPELAAVYRGEPWRDHRAALVAVALDTRAADSRRRSFIAQVVAEVAGGAGDLASCTLLIEHAVRQGLLDLHWLDRCPLLAPVRATGSFAAARARVRARAEAVLDALYGDHVLPTVETQLAG
ncbi:MAG TPA: protein kinase [Kofleriaceae bacterium]|nr:protein kinase [Kofleriaceae bacterium]